MEGRALSHAKMDRRGGEEGPLKLLLKLYLPFGNGPKKEIFTSTPNKYHITLKTLEYKKEGSKRLKLACPVLESNQ